MAELEPLSEKHLDHPSLVSDMEFVGLLREPDLADLHPARERRRVLDALEGGAWGLACDDGISLVRPLAWDSEHFGHGCADLTRVYLSDPSAGTLAPGVDALLDATIEECRRRGVALLSGRLPAGWIPLLRSLTDRGARLVDTSVELGRRLPLSSPEGAPDLVVREGKPDEAEVLADIAQGFTQNRFYRDPRIPASLARGVYRGWAHAALEGRHGNLVLAEDKGDVAGLATYLTADADLQVGLVALVAVHPRFRGRRVLDALMAGCEQRLGGRVLVTSTQVSNGAALRAFGRHGLLPFAARHIFHAWLD